MQRVGQQIDGRQRAVTLAMVALLHLLAILAVLASRAPLVPIEPDMAALALFEPIVPDPPPVEPLPAEAAKPEAPAGPPADRAAPSGPPLRSAPAAAPPAPDRAIPAPAPAPIPPVIRLPSPLALPLAPSTIDGTADAIDDAGGGGDSTGRAMGGGGAGGGGAGGGGAGGDGMGGDGDGRLVRYAAARWVRKPTKYDWSLAWPRQNGKWIEGEAVLGCELKSSGRPKRCWVIAERPGNVGVGLAAVRLSRSFVVRHVLRDGEATDMWVRVPISFRLRKR